MKAYGVKKFGQLKNHSYPHGCNCAICWNWMYPKKHKAQKHAARQAAKAECSTE